MKGRLPAIAGCAAVLAASHLTDGLFVLGGAIALLLLLAWALAAARTEPRWWTAPASLAALVGLALLPGEVASQPGPLSIALGLVAAAGVLVAAGEGLRPPDRVAPGAFLSRHALTLAATLALAAAMLAGGWLARSFGPDALRLGEEWNGPYGVLLGALPFLLAGGLVLLVLAALRRERPATDEDADDLDSIDPQAGLPGAALPPAAVAAAPAPEPAEAAA